MNCSYLDSGIRGDLACFSQAEDSVFRKNSNSSMLKSFNSRTLMVTIRQSFYPMTEEVLYQVFSPYGFVQKIEVNNNFFKAQALVQFLFSCDADRASRNLQGRNIYDGCCRMEIDHVEEVNQLTGDCPSFMPTASSDEKIETFHDEIHDLTRTLAKAKDESLQTNLFHEDSVTADLEENKCEVDVEEVVTPYSIQSEALDEDYSIKFVRNQHLETISGGVEEVISYSLANEQLVTDINYAIVLDRLEKSTTYLTAHKVFDKMSQQETFDLFFLLEMKVQQGDFKVSCDGISTKYFVHNDGFETRIGKSMARKFFIVLFDPGGITKQETQGNMLAVNAIKCGVVVGKVCEELEELSNASKVLDEMRPLNDGFVSYKEVVGIFRDWLFSQKQGC